MSSLQETGLIVSLIMSTISFLSWVYTVGFKMGALDTKVATLWEVYVKDALSEVARMRSGNPEPFNIKEYFSETLIDNIKRIGALTKYGSKHKHDELVIQLEKNFGDDFMKIATEKKMPYRVLIGTALLIAEGTVK